MTHETCHAVSVWCVLCMFNTIHFHRCRADGLSHWETTHISSDENEKVRWRPDIWFRQHPQRLWDVNSVYASSQWRLLLNTGSKIYIWFTFSRFLTPSLIQHIYFHSSYKRKGGCTLCVNSGLYNSSSLIQWLYYKEQQQLYCSLLHTYKCLGQV